MNICRSCVNSRLSERIESRTAGEIRARCSTGVSLGLANENCEIAKLDEAFFDVSESTGSEMLWDEEEESMESSRGSIRS